MVTLGGEKILSEGVLGGPGVLTPAQSGGLFLPGPPTKPGLKRGRGNVPSVLRVQIGQVFKGQNRKVLVDRSKQRIRAAESSDLMVRCHPLKSATAEEKLCARDTQIQKFSFLRKALDTVISKLSGDTWVGSG